jgi:hypothetical protein
MCALRLAATVKPATLLNALGRQACNARIAPDGSFATPQLCEARQARTASKPSKQLNEHMPRRFRLRCDVLPGTRAVAHISI